MHSSIFDYYKEAAKILGGRADADGTYSKQAAYSLYWFFCENEVDGLNPLTKSFLDDPGNHQELTFGEALPQNLEQYFLENASPNESQKLAIETALTNAISFVQGPPGTGKTATILNLVSCITALHRTVAVVSGNNSAIQNIEDKVAEYQPCDPNKWRVHESLAKLGSADKRKAFNAEDRYPKKFKTEKVSCGEIEISREGSIQAGDFLKKYPFITSTIHSLKKCFADGAAYQYDYVIIDESSQVDCIAGIVAMSAAKHLVLIGDDEQLPPVVDMGKLRKMQTDLSVIPELYRLKENRSFLSVCRKAFEKHESQERKINVLLKEHYRCHPGIIEFCNRYVYDNKLAIKTGGYDAAHKVPITVWWFEGNYCERCYCNNGTRVSKRNRKQVKIFIEKEWKRLVGELTGDNPPSVCILTPFLGQLEELDRAIRQYNEENGIKLQVLFSGQEGMRKEAEDEDAEHSVPMLTVHKSQGREFDIVYFLPVEDGDWEYPWSQHKRLVNVAVSRAKRELRVIASAQIMSEPLQRSLTKAYIAPSVGSGHNSDNADEQRFTQQLLDYVRECSEDSFPESGTEYGFHSAGMHSTFDIKPQILQQRAQDKAKHRSSERTVKQYAPEIIVRDILLHLPVFRENSLRLYRDVLIKDLQMPGRNKIDLSELGEAEKEYYDNGCQLDFLICRNSKIVAAIEVDGSGHRFKESRESHAVQQRNDEMKDNILENCFEGMPFIRLSDDGSMEDEDKLLSDAIVRGMKRIEDGTWYRFAAISTSALVDKYNRSKIKKGEDIDIVKLREILIDAGLLQAEVGKDSQFFRPTVSGKFRGIAIGTGLGNDGEVYEVPYYAGCAEYPILRLIAKKMQTKGAE